MIRPNTITTLIALIVFSATSGMAAESFDIDLKELKPAKAAKPSAKPAVKPAVKPQSLEIDLKELKATRPKKSKHKNVKKKQETKSASAVIEAEQAKAGKSVYTVRPGDHLALILVQHYGLSEVEARRLMPEIMRINSISSPQKVAVGQRLIIPLPLASVQQAKKEATAPRETQDLPQQKTEPVKPDVPAAETPLLNVDLTYVEACSLARQVSEKLGLLLVKPSLEVGGSAFSARYEDIVVTVVCDPAPAEAITYQRLLGMKGEQLLVVASNSSARQVIDSLAESLGLTYRMVGAGRQDTLPLKYVFTDTAPARPEMQLTISAAAP